MRVLAIAITYNPDVALLAEVLHSIAPQARGVVIVDNGSANAAAILEIASTIRAHVIANTQNRGIAAAQNQGIDFAEKNDFSHVLLLDQDTVLSPKVVADLSAHLKSLELDCGNVAAIGPAYFEVHSRQRTRAYRSAGLLLSRIPLATATQPVESDFIIASGSLIPIPVFKKIGPFNEDLFIDLVDVDWCFRARAAGYRCFISPTAVVEHRLGAGTVKIGQRRVAIHVPIRNYYWVRNALWLARQPYTPLAWRLYFRSRVMAFLATYPTVGDRRGLRLRLIYQGIKDGIGGNLGPINEIT